MINWHDIDTVLLDMDGTLLDLHFDNYFWLDYLPQRYAEIRQLDLRVAREHLEDHIRRHEGTLKWYCLEFWSDALQVDIRSLKAEIKHKIRMRPHVEEFLTRLRQHSKKLLLVTSQTARRIEGYPAIHHFDEIMPPPPGGSGLLEVKAL